MEAGESIVPSCGIVGEDTRRTPELDLAGSETVVEPLLLTADTGGGDMGVVGNAGVVGVTGVTGVGGMLESLRLIWLCSEGPLRPFMELSLLLDFTLDGGLGFC